MIRNLTGLSKYNLSQPWVLVIAGILSFFLYLLLALFYFQPNAFWSPDEGAKFLQMQSLGLSNQKLTLSIPYGGLQIDPNYQYALSEHPKDLLTISKERELQFERLPIFPALTKPLYSLLGFYGLYLIPALSGVLISIMTMLLIPAKDRSWIMWSLICFASPVWIYSLLFWEHTLAIALCFLGFALLIFTNKKSFQPTILLLLYFSIALLFGLSFYLRLETLLLSGAFLIACLFLEKQRRGWLILTICVLLLLFVVYGILHSVLFQGNPAPMNARYLYKPFDYLRSAGWRSLSDLLVGASEDEAINTNWLGGLWTIASIIAIAHSFASHPTRTTIALQWIGLTVCTLVAAWFLLNPYPYRAAHGLFFTTPWAILGFMNIQRTWEQNQKPLRIFILTILLGLFAYTIVMLFFRGSSPHGGLEWGARFAMGFYPLLAIIAAWYWLDQKLINIILLLALFLCGLGFQIRGIRTIHKDRLINVAFNEAIENIPEENIASDLWWFLLNSAPVPTSKAIYSLQGFEEFVEWVRLMESNANHRFALVTLDRTLPWHLRFLHPDLNIQVQEIIRVEDLWLFRLEIIR